MGSSSQTEYLRALEKMLWVLDNSQNVLALEALFPIFREKNHVHESIINRYLEKFIKKTSPDTAVSAFELCLKHAMSKQHQDILRSFSIRNYLQNHLGQKIMCSINP